jgi:hypothetical protein
MAATNIRVLIPRVRRAVEGVGEPARLSDDEIKDIVADAIADVILFTGSAFEKTLAVVSYDTVTGYPAEYETSEELTLPEGSLIAIQAALTTVYIQLKEAKTSETIRDEGQEWSYTFSANVLRDRIKQLQDERNRALDSLTYSSVGFIDLWYERDRQASMYLEILA